MDTTYRIIVGVDGSTESIRALRWATGEAAGRGGTVQAVIVYDWVATEGALLAGLGPELERDRAANALTKAVDEVQPHFPSVSITAEVLQGRPAERLTEAARDANLLVVGSHGHGRLYHAVLGSISEGCVRLSPCPVVVIPPPHPAPQRTPAVDAVEAPSTRSAAEV